MKKLISKETELHLLKLGLYQIVGGAIGLLVFLWVVYSGQLFTGPVIILYVLIFIFYVYSIYCGILCIKVKQSALKLSLINQLIQLIGFTVFGFAFNYVAGVYIRVGLDITSSMNFDFGIGISRFWLSTISEPDRFIIDINLIALVLIIWIDNVRTAVKEEIAFRNMSSIVSSIGE
jgi:hypothetical protein